MRGTDTRGVEHNFRVVGHVRERVRRAAVSGQTRVARVVTDDPTPGSTSAMLKRSGYTSVESPRPGTSRTGSPSPDASHHNATPSRDVAITVTVSPAEPVDEESRPHRPPPGCRTSPRRRLHLAGRKLIGRMMVVLSLSQVIVGVVDLEDASRRFTERASTCSTGVCTRGRDREPGDPTRRPVPRAAGRRLASGSGGAPLRAIAARGRSRWRPARALVTPHGRDRGGRGSARHHRRATTARPT